MGKYQGVIPYSLYHYESGSPAGDLFLACRERGFDGNDFVSGPATEIKTAGTTRLVAKGALRLWQNQVVGAAGSALYTPSAPTKFARILIANSNYGSGSEDLQLRIVIDGDTYYVNRWRDYDGLPMGGALLNVPKIVYYIHIYRTVAFANLAIYNDGPLKPVSITVGAYDDDDELGSGDTDVNVVNTPNVSVTNTPNIAVTNTPNVSVTNTPNVQVTNTPAVTVTGTPDINLKSIATTCNLAIRQIQ